MPGGKEVKNSKNELTCEAKNWLGHEVQGPSGAAEEANGQVSLVEEGGVEIFAPQVSTSGRLAF